MQLKLTIIGDAAQLASVLAVLGAGAPGAIAAPIIETDDDDDGLHPAFNAVPMPVPAPAALAETLLQNHAAQVATPAAPVAAPVADNARDSEGLPWDKRIHASSKAFNADGSWRKKRNLDETILNAVLNELRTANPATVPVVAPVAAAPVVPPMPVVNADGEQMPPAVAPVPMSTAPIPAVAPVVPPMPTPEPVAPVAAAPVVEPIVPAAPAAVPASIDMPTFMMHIGPKMGTLITPDYLAGVTAEISTAFGQPLTVITDIAANPAMIKYAADVLARDGKW